jgi:hypothetical protein
MELSRRKALLSALCGASALGLRSLVTGLPIAWLADPRRALAAEPDAACQAISTTPQFLVLSTSSAGDPVNANVPGTYDDARVQHSIDAAMQKTQLTLGGRRVSAAKPWAELPDAVLARTSFFHHATLTNAHPNQPKVMRLMGQTRRQEMLVSMYAKQLAPCLGTIQREPVVVGAKGSGELLAFEGRTIANLSPKALRSVLASDPGPLTDLRALRDRDLDRMNALFKEHGTNVQRQFLDRLALSQREARAIPEQLIASLSEITSDDVDGQIIAAATLIKMKVSPVVSIHIPFGGDNHTDGGFARETTETLAGVASIKQLLATLSGHGLADQTTFALMNVFGRTLSSTGTKGRNHHPAHAVGVMIGKGVRSSLVGGIAFQGKDFAAQPIDSESGEGGDGGDIAYGSTMGAFAKTLGRALGIGEEVLDEEVLTGKVVRAAVA